MNYSKIFLALTLVLAPTLSFAQGAGHVGGGGEDGVFKSIRDEVSTWLKKNDEIGALEKKLELTTISGHDLNLKFQKATRDVADQIIFNHDEIKFGNNIRICKNDQDLKVITCNIDEWNKTQGKTRYMIVFHEYLGIAGIETNIAEYSTYPISPKIFGYVHTKNSFELGMDKASSLQNSFVAKAKELFNQSSSVNAATISNFLTWGTCTGVYLNSTNGMRSENGKTELAGEYYWADFPEFEKFDFKKVTDDLFLNKALPNLPYSPEGLPQSSILLEPSLLIATSASYTVTAKITRRDIIVAEAAANPKSQFYESFKKYSGDGIKDSSLAPFAYFICTY